MKEDKKPPSVIGIDVGTSRIVMARQRDGEFQFASELNAFVGIPASKMAEKALKRENVPYTNGGPEIVVHGNHAPRFADLLNVEARRPMTQGMLNPSEKESLPIVRSIVQSLLGEDAGRSPRVCFSVPAAPLHATESLTYHESALRQTIAEWSGEVTSLNEGLAVIYSELEDSNYTGIGISCGGGLCNVCLAYLSMPAVSFSIPKAGDFIDASAASVVGDLATRVRLTKEESFYLNGAPTDQLHQALTVYYDDMIQSLVQAMREAFHNSRRMPRISQPVPVVLSGGTATPKGFLERFEQALRAVDLPVAISDVRLAKDPLTATARGALIAGLTEN
jgi:hypothetical protein